MTTSSIDRSGEGYDEPAAVTEIRIADVAATAARTTPGVAYLQPGLWGLVHQLGAELWTQVTGKPHPDTAGVEVSAVDRTTTIDIMLVTDGTRPAAAVGLAVQRRVHQALTRTCAVTTSRIAIHITDIALPS